MEIRNLPDTVAAALFGLAHRLDEAATDRELVNGSTITGRVLSTAATAAVFGAMSWVVLDVATGGPARRGHSGSGFESSTAADAQAPVADPIWREFLRR